MTFATRSKAPLLLLVVFAALLATYAPAVNACTWIANPAVPDPTPAGWAAFADIVVVGTVMGWDLAANGTDDDTVLVAIHVDSYLKGSGRDLAFVTGLVAFPFHLDHPCAQIVAAGQRLLLFLPLPDWSETMYRSYHDATAATIDSIAEVIAVTGQNESPQPASTSEWLKASWMSISQVLFNPVLFFAWWMLLPVACFIFTIVIIRRRRRSLPPEARQELDRTEPDVQA